MTVVSISHNRPDAQPRSDLATAPALADLDLLVLDFDGVLTDNGVWTGPDGAEWVRCDRSDSWGLARLCETGLPVLVLSTEENPVVAARCAKLRLPVEYGVADKAGRLAAVLRERGIDAQRVAYVGNDVNDLGCLRLAGWPVAVADSWPEVIDAARLVLRRPGGHGAVRELCDLLLTGAAQAF
jgi:N-acylneuraminate cytidylyltransferase